MARISVVVPIHRVERYLAECLQSIARQTVADLEVIMVDDGSPDDSVVIAGRFAEADERFRLFRQPNRGLGAARNRGVDAACGEYLAFVDSDDVLPPDAYERLLGALERTGSDFASGAVRRLEGDRLVPAPFLSETFATTRLRTHVTRFPPLQADRTAWNKLWRRSFWDQHVKAFPEGVWHEDIPVTVPAHYAATAVDVIAAPVYHWRKHPDGGRSITQRRLEHVVLDDRFAAVERVYDHLRASGPAGAADEYRRRLVRDDLRLHLDVFAEADDAYRAEFARRATVLLEGTTDRIFSGLPAIDRLKWHLVRRGLLEEAAQVVHFHARDWPLPPVRHRGRWYGDFPFCDDRELRIPRSVYRLGRADQDLSLSVMVDAFADETESQVTLRGSAAITAFGAPDPGEQELRVQALAPGRWQRLRARTRGGALPVRQEPLNGAPLQDRWSGWAATLDADALEWLAGGQPRELCVSVRARGLRRRRTRFEVSDAVLRPRALRTSNGAVILVAVRADGTVRIEPRPSRAELSTYRFDGDDLLLHGDVTLPSRTFPRLEATRRNDSHHLSVPVELEDTRATFRARLPLTELADWRPSAQRLAGGPETLEPWAIEITFGTARMPIAFPEFLPAARYLGGSIEVAGGLTGELLVTRRAVEVPATVPAPPRARPGMVEAG